MCFRNLVLNALAVTPMYDFVSLLSDVVTSALYTTLSCGQWLALGIAPGFYSCRDVRCLCLEV